MSKLNFCADYAIEYVVFWRNLYHWQKLYTATDSDGSNKYHLCGGDGDIVCLVIVVQEQ